MNRKSISDWSRAPEELLELIISNLDIADLIRFSCVCRHWRSLSKHPQWLILPWDINSKNGFVGLVNFFDPSHKILKLQLPGPPTRTRICGSSAGWILSLHTDGKVRLLNPFNRAKIELPPLTFLNWRRVMKGIVFKSSSSSSAFDVVVIAEPTFLVFCNGKDKRWSFTNGDPGKFKDIVLYKNKFYTLYRKNAKNYVCITSGLDSYSPKMFQIMEIPINQKQTKPYLVGSSGDLLLVLRHLDWNFGSKKPSKTIGFTIYKIDITEKKVVELKNIGRDSALFLDRFNGLLFFPSDTPGCKGNCIYFVADCFSSNYVRNSFGWNDTGVFNLEDGTIGPLNYCCDNKLVMQPPIWYS